MGEIELTVEELLARPIVAITVNQELSSAIDCMRNMQVRCLSRLKKIMSDFTSPNNSLFITMDISSYYFYTYSLDALMTLRRESCDYTMELVKPATIESS